MRYLILTFILSIAFTSNAQNFAAVQVDGIGCPFCAYGLEKKFKELKKVKAFEIDLDAGIVTFKGVEDAKLTKDLIVERVRIAGYTPTSIGIGTDKKNSIEVMTEIEQILKTDPKGQVIEFQVSGNCGMCKVKIETAAKNGEGVLDAIWDKEKKTIVVSFLPETTNKEKIEILIATVGYDTENYEAAQVVYDNLPACCQYRE